jgi:NitT/TauT family transport system permease protein
MTVRLSVGWTRLFVTVAFVGALELLCREGVINRTTMIPPSEMAMATYRLFASGKVWRDVLFTLHNLAWAIAASIVLGFGAGAVLQSVPRVRRVLDPLFSAYYSVPVFVFYPLLIVMFGISSTSLIVMGAVFGVVAMIVNTMIGLDKVARAYVNTARVLRLGPARGMFLVRLPAAAPHILTGVRLAVAYSVIGVVAGEFILAGMGIGKRIAVAYNDFDNPTMYGLLLFILVFVVILNGFLHRWESQLHRRWARA